LLSSVLAGVSSNTLSQDRNEKMIPTKSACASLQNNEIITGLTYLVLSHLPRSHFS